MFRKTTMVVLGLSLAAVACDKSADESAPAGSQSADESTSARERAPATGGEAEEESIGRPGACSTDDCREACEAYEGDDLKACARAFSDGCFGPERDEDICGKFGVSDEGGAPPGKAKKKEKLRDGQGLEQDDEKPEKPFVDAPDHETKEADPVD